MGSMKVQTKKVDIDVHATEADDGTVHFACHWRHTGGKPGVWKSGKIDLPNGPEAYELEFKLHDKSGRNLKFYGTGTPKKPEDAMYVQVFPVLGRLIQQRMVVGIVVAEDEAALAICDVPGRYAHLLLT